MTRFLTLTILDLAFFAMVSITSAAMAVTQALVTTTHKLMEARRGC